MREIEEELINNLNALANNVELYPPKHPLVIKNAEKILELLRPVIVEKDMLTIGVREGIISIDGKPIFSIQSAKMLGRNLSTIKIGSVEFISGLKVEELITFFNLLAKVRSSKSEDLIGIIQENLSRLNIKHIKVYPEEEENIKERARKVYKDAKNTIIEIMKEARVGRMPDAYSARRVVSEFDYIMKKNKNILLGFIMIQHFDEYTFSHCVNVGIMALAIAKTLKIGEESALEIGLGGFLHDIGKVKTPKEIILKPAPLTSEEWTVMQRHPVEGAKIVSRMKGIPYRVPIYIYQHHVGYDLSGYPKLKPGEKQSDGANIIAIADTYDSMTTQRPYQKRFDPKESMDIMKRKVGRVFKEEFFEAFVNTIGIYPVGSIVRLDTNEIAVVTELNERDAVRPKVKIIFDSMGKRLPEPVEVSLAETTPGGNYKRSIVKTVDSVTRGLINITPFFE